jgi:hypothetical protein
MENLTMMILAATLFVAFVTLLIAQILKSKE